MLSQHRAHAAGVPAAGMQRKDRAATHRHVERMGRARALELTAGMANDDDELLERDLWPGASLGWSQRAAKGMLRDFEEAGLDEDLEELKASWSSSFKPRWPMGSTGANSWSPADTARSQRSVPSMRSSPSRGASHFSTSHYSVDDDDDDDDMGVSRLALEGERAKARLATLDAIRSIAGGKRSTALPARSSMQSAMASLPNRSYRGGGALALWDSWSPEHLLHNNSNEGRYGSGMSGASASSGSRRARARDMAVTVPDLSRSLHEAGHSKARGAGTDDGWETWERRWAKEFEQFEEIERARRWREAAEERAAQEEAEEAWRQKVEWAKNEAEELKRRAAASKGNYTNAASGSGSSSAWAGHARQQSKPSQHTPPPSTSSSSRKQHWSGAGPSPSSSSSSSSSDKQHDTSHHNSYHHRSAGAQSDRPSGAPPPPSPPKASVNQQQAASRPAVRSFASFADFDAAWQQFETTLAQGGGGRQIGFSDVPWPTSLASVSGAGASDSHADQKRKLRSALVRWHPDKWGPILEKVKESERAMLMEQVKEVTQRILEEKRRFSC